MTFQWPWAPYIPTLYIISGVVQYLVHNNLSLWSNCQLLVFPCGLPLVSVPFFQSPRSQMGFFLKSQTVYLKTLQTTEIENFVICSCSNFQWRVPVDLQGQHSQVAVIYFWFFWALICVFYLDSLSDCVIKVHVVIV